MRFQGQRDAIHFPASLGYLALMIQYSKYQGLGNDFIIIDLRSSETSGHPRWIDWSRRACERRYGIGADGVLLVTHSQQGDLRMHVINADGSRPEMCGNGLRCFVHYAVIELEVRKPELIIETDAGLLDCKWTLDDTGCFKVRVNMGRPKLTPPPFTHDYKMGGPPLRIHPVNMGNPHGVIFLEEQKERSWMQGFAETVAQTRQFPDGVNVGFSVIRGQVMNLIVHERGCGFTEACGTGACAAVAAAITEGHLPWGSKVDVNLPGGALTIEWDQGMPIYMEGPSERISTGQSFIEWPESSFP